MDFLYNRSTKDFRRYIRKFYGSLAAQYPNTHIIMGQLINPLAVILGPNRITAPLNPLLMIPGFPMRCMDSHKLARFGTVIGLYPGYRGPLVEKYQSRFLSTEMKWLL